MIYGFEIKHFDNLSALSGVRIPASRSSSIVQQSLGELFL